jgi:hypothetical protein
VHEHLEEKKIKGGVFLFDFNNVEAGPKRLKIPSTDSFSIDTFHPHGISVWEDKDAGEKQGWAWVEGSI